MPRLRQRPQTSRRLLSAMWKPRAVEYSIDRQSVSAALRQLWLVLLGLSLVGCSGTESGSVETAALEPESSASAYMVDSRETEQGTQPANDPAERWNEAVQWTRSPESLGILEFDQAPEIQWLTQLVSQPSCTALVLRHGGLGEKGLECLVPMQQLKRLVVQESGWTEPEFLAVSQLVQLENLNVDQASLSARALRELAGLPELKSLRLGQQGEALVLADELSAAKRLEHLHLIGFELTSEAQVSLDRLPTLRTLYLDRCQFDEAWLAKWQDAENGRHVHVDELHLSELR